MGEFDHEDPVWKLLGKARRIEASARFAAGVMRAVEAGNDRAASWIPAWIFRAALPAAACAALALLAVAGSWRSSGPVGADHSMEAIVDFETIADLDLLVLNSDSQPW